MEEQKKPDGNASGNAGGKHHGRKHHRRHGYFIEPPKDNAADTATVAQPKAAETAKPAEQSAAQKPEGNANPSNHKHKRNRHHNKNKKGPKPAEQNPQAQAPEKSEAERPQKNQNQQNKKKQNDKPKSVPFNPPTQSKPAPTHASDEYEEYKLFVDDPAESTDTEHTEETVDRTEVIGIRFKSTGKIYYFDPDGKKYQKGSKAIVDTARGQEFGEVASSNSFVRSSDIVPPLRKVIRSATDEDIEHHKANKQKEEDAFKICNEKIAAHGLDMKLIEAQYTFDNTKLLFYFTSSDRVDFRNLVKDLASVFRTRIELRQIGIRDEAKLMGGLGMCGRPLCCTLFLSDFDQVSIKMAKEQNLSLNSAKISGICGRLMCCLRYEHEAYEYEIKRTPPVGSLVRTENGDGHVTEINPLRRTVKVSLIASPEVPPKVYNRDEVTMLRKKKQD
ncbi:MAG: hypothetical protein E7653_06130 [Ruminococcaceae bacterium]|nr:hypothetical protein [Oscillospiraceae bacterium]